MRSNKPIEDINRLTYPIFDEFTIRPFPLNPSNIAAQMMSFIEKPYEYTVENEKKE